MLSIKFLKFFVSAKKVFRNLSIIFFSMLIGIVFASSYAIFNTRIKEQNILSTKSYDLNYKTIHQVNTDKGSVFGISTKKSRVITFTKYDKNAHLDATTG